MKRRTIIIALLALLIPGVLLAQSEDTLEELVAVLTGRIQNVEERLEKLELRHSPATMSVDPDSNFCRIVGLDGDSLLLQKETLLAYVEKYGDSPDYVTIGLVEMSPNGYVAIRWDARFDDVFVFEIWEIIDGKCVFNGHSEWNDG